MKALITTAAYPTCNGDRPQYFVHSRNLYYIKAGIDVTVLNFATTKGYVIDGVKVISLCEFENSVEPYDLLICHAANIRNHYMFLMKHATKFKNKVFFFHGHEVLHVNKYYPKPYWYVKKKKLPAFLQNIYDTLKIHLWRNYFLKNLENTKLIFVSSWIYKQFLSETKIARKKIEPNTCVINNSIGEFFEKNRYQPRNLIYDFITIRNNLDGSKYGVDIVVELAKNNPQYTFCLVGKGSFFEYYNKPKNLEWIDREMSHEEMADYINMSKVALMPTREDTQGLMACELAAFGLPLITSDIDVCNEIFANCHRCTLISNESPDLEAALRQINLMDIDKIWDEYFSYNTIEKEISFLKSI